MLLLQLKLIVICNMFYYTGDASLLYKHTRLRIFAHLSSLHFPFLHSKTQVRPSPVSASAHAL